MSKRKGRGGSLNTRCDACATRPAKPHRGWMACRQCKRMDGATFERRCEQAARGVVATPGSAADVGDEGVRVTRLG